MPPLIFPGGTSTGSGTPFVSAWRAIADELGEYTTITVADEATLAVHPDADRQILSEQLTADQKSARRFDGFWAYVVDGAHAGSTRMALETTFDGPYGSLLVDRRFLDGNGNSDPLAANVEVDLTSPLPVGRHLTLKGIKDAVLDALRMFYVDTRLSLVGTGSRSIDLGDSAFIALGAQVDSVWQRRGSTEPYEQRANDARVVQDGAALTLVTDVAIPSGEVFQLRVLRRPFTLVKTSGTWGVSTTGPVNATDEIPAPLHWIKAWGMVQALKACIVHTRRDMSLTSEQKRERIDGEYGYTHRLRIWTRACRQIKASDEYPKLSPRRKAGLISGVFEDYATPSGTAVTGWP